MEEITAYKCFDGTIFEDEDAAIKYAKDKLGEEIDGLLKLFNLDISRVQEYRGILQLMNREKELYEATKRISQILEH
jgi:hypothetical protein